MNYSVVRHRNGGVFRPATGRWNISTLKFNGQGKVLHAQSDYFVDCTSYVPSFILRTGSEVIVHRNLNPLTLWGQASLCCCPLSVYTISRDSYNTQQLFPTQIGSLKEPRRILFAVRTETLYTRLLYIISTVQRQWPNFEPVPVCVGLVVLKIALTKFYTQVVLFSACHCHSINAPF